jgi:phosphoribosylformimino-5-aminoimidazole carboxamide ribotide isomerase
MTNFRVLPAIDLVNGESVRLQKGVLQTAERVHECPIKQAIEYENLGAQWLHVVNLDAAFNQNSEKSDAVLQNICKNTKLKIQFGGGVRNIARLHEVVSLGVEKVVLGTWLWNEVFRSDKLKKELAAHSEKIVAGIDVFDNLSIATHGWKESNRVTLGEARNLLREIQVTEALCTQISRDGMLTGIDVEFLGRVAAQVGVCVLASGGVRNMTDVRNALLSPAVSGIVLGKSLTAKTLCLEQVFQVLKEEVLHSAPECHAI